MKKNYKIGCYQWMLVVGWPNPGEDFSCCFDCHETLAHVQDRYFQDFSYIVCCGVKTLCLKKLHKNVIIKKYKDAKSMTLKKWMGLYGPKTAVFVPSIAADTDSYIINTIGSSG